MVWQNTKWRKIVPKALPVPLQWSRNWKREFTRTVSFFITIRRQKPLVWILNLWRYDAKRQGGHHEIRVKFLGEDGIDSGALTREVFSEVIPAIANTLFPNGSQINSTCHVQNSHFRATGKIVANSLAQAGQWTKLASSECGCNPEISPAGSTPQGLEEIPMDNFHDFLMALDGAITGYDCPNAWNYTNHHLENVLKEVTEESLENSDTVELTSAEMMGWLTGKKRRQLNGGNITIIAKFDHECLMRNPSHTISFHLVGATLLSWQFLKPAFFRSKWRLAILSFTGVSLFGVKRSVSEEGIYWEKWWIWPPRNRYLAVSIK